MDYVGKECAYPLVLCGRLDWGCLPGPIDLELVLHTLSRSTAPQGGMTGGVAALSFLAVTSRWYLMQPRLKWQTEVEVRLAVALLQAVSLLPVSEGACTGAAV